MEEEKKTEKNMEEKENELEKNLKDEEKETEKTPKEKKEKSEVKKVELEADKLASIYWWKTFSLQLLMLIIWSIILVIAGKYITSLFENSLNNYEASLKLEELLKFNNSLFVVESIITLVFSIIFILIAVRLAFNSISKKIIIKTNKLKTAIKSYKLKTYVLLMIEIVCIVFLAFAKEVSILAGLIYAVSSFIIAFIQNAYAHKLLKGIAEDDFPI